jgi:hypothetical protein
MKCVTEFERAATDDEPPHASCFEQCSSSPPSRPPDSLQDSLPDSIHHNEYHTSNIKTTHARFSIALPHVDRVVDVIHMFPTWTLYYKSPDFDNMTAWKRKFVRVSNEG